jgi:hypothetical protein
MPRGRRSTNAAAQGQKAAGRSRLGRRGRARRAGSDGRLAEIVARYVGSLVDAVRQEVRRSVADEVREVLTGSRAAGLSAGRSRRAGNGRKRVLPCIKPGCNSPSKGPRFHYLCDEHKDAKRSEYEAWRKARKEKQAA